MSDDHQTPSDLPPDPDGRREPRAGRAVRADDEVPWERRALRDLAFAALKEQRSARRWGIFFKLAFLAYASVLIVWAAGAAMRASEADLGSRHTALINLQGVIDLDGQASAEKIDSALQTAFKDSGTAGVILRINSPGGSPVQASMIHDEIIRLRKQYPAKPLYVVVEEVCASGGYYAAVAADKIFVNKASVVGSIGVLMDGFGFTGTMDKLGVERRLMTAGKNKGIGDPFSPQSDEQKAYLQSMLDEIHLQFIAVVKAGRGSRLKETPDMFSGLFWTGAKSVEMGLADDFGTVDSVAKEVIKAEDVVDYTEKESLPERLSRRFGATLAGAFVDTIGTRLRGAGSVR